MNIFFLDTNPSLAARKQVTKSATKMVLETAQLLSDAVRTYGYNGGDVYKGAYHNHPSTVWTRKSKEHFQWLCEHGLELCEMYTQKFGKIHKSQAIIERCLELDSLLPSRGFKIIHEDLAIKSTAEGIKALRVFQKSKGTFTDAVTAYTTFYFAKDYVKEALGQ
jgi:hypothetical protein